MNSVIQVEEVSFSYGETRVLHDCSLEVKAGEFVSLLGPNGAGKSTLLSLISGSRRPESGMIRVDEKRLAEWPPRPLAKRLAVVPQGEAPPAALTVRELVMLGRFPHREGVFGFEGERDCQAVLDALDRVDAREISDRPLGKLSGGQKQLAVLARALAQEPGVLLLDEPAASLDIRHIQDLFRLLRKLKEEGLTVLTVTHDLNVAALYSDRLILMKEGRIEAAGVPAELLREEILQRIYGAEIWCGSAPDGTPLVGLKP